MANNSASPAITSLQEVNLTLNSVRVLSDINLEVYPNEIVGLVGANGAGKSSVANVLCGYYKPTSGKVFLRDFDVTIAQSARFASLGVRRSFQNVSYLKGLAVYELVMLGAETTWRSALGNSYLGQRKTRHEERIVREDAMELLENTGLGEFAKRAIDNCPYGIRKLADVARAFMGSSSTLTVLDEPTSGIGEPEREHLVQMINTLRNSRPVGSLLIVDHDVGFIRSLCNRVIVLEAGRVLADGASDEVFADRRVITSFVGSRQTSDKG